MKKYYIKTLGCKTNQIESNLIAEKFEAIGLERAKTPKEADVYVLNSCSVTSNADDDSIRLMRKQKRENRTSYVILTGCFAQLEGDKVAENDFVDLVLGNTEKMHITDYVSAELSLPAQKSAVSDIFEQEKFIYERIQNPTKTRAWLKVQDGCNNRCSYCTIRKARGKSRSSRPEDILDQINIYAEHGFQELVLTGIHIGQWGGDLAPKKGMLELVELIESSPIKRFRLGSLNPHELTRELLTHLSQSEKFCPHFHMSLQSACNKTLKAMNRHYTVEEYLEQIDFINEKFTLPFLGSDIIVGFPGETDEDFETTYNNIEKSGLTAAHIFPYSIRKGTQAAEMSEQVPQKIKIERAARLKKLTDIKCRVFVERNIMTTSNILFEKGAKYKNENGNPVYKGVTQNYLTVYAENAPGKPDITGRIIPCRLKSVDFTGTPKIYGEILN